MDNTIIATVVLGIIGIGITAYYSRHTKRLAHDQMLKELFTEFNTRYDRLNNILRKIEEKYPDLEKLNAAKNPEKIKQKVIDYFILCSEEFFWYYHKKRIDKTIWNSWQAGMLYWYSIPTIKSLWENEVAESGKASYYITNHVEFFEPTSL